MHVVTLYACSGAGGTGESYRSQLGGFSQFPSAFSAHVLKAGG